MKPVSLMMALLLIATGTVRAQTKDTPPQTEQPQFLGCAIAVAAAAGLVVYSVWRCAQTAGLTSTNKPPSMSTNGYGANIPLPGGGNGGTGTNGFTEVFAPGVFYPDIVLATNIDQFTATKTDISAMGWTDWQGNPFTWFYKTTTATNGPHIQTSSDTIHWTDQTYTVNMWLSSATASDPNMTAITNMVVVMCDSTGTPLSTNWGPAIGRHNMGVPRLAGHMYYRGVTP